MSYLHYSLIRFIQDTPTPRVVSDIFENIFINNGNIEKYFSESHSEVHNPKYKSIFS